LETLAILALATSFVAAASFGVFLAFLATISDHNGFLDDLGVLVESLTELRGVFELILLICGVLAAGILGTAFALFGVVDFLIPTLKVLTGAGVFGRFLAPFGVLAAFGP